MASPLPTVEPIEPSLGTSLGRALELAQRVAGDELRLLQLESQEFVRGTLLRSVWIGVGLFCLMIAWLALLAAAVVALEPRLSLEARLALLALFQGAAGGALVAWGARGGGRP
jgi:Putative Actinobacterial Holin-X, holin superfamily III